MSNHTYTTYTLVEHNSSITPGATSWQGSTSIVTYTEGIVDEITVFLQYKRPKPDSTLTEYYLVENADNSLVIVLMNGGVNRRFDLSSKLSIRREIATSNGEDWEIVTVQARSDRIFSSLALPPTGNSYIRVGIPAPRFSSPGLSFYRGLMQVRYRSVIGNKPF